MEELDRAFYHGSGSRTGVKKILLRSDEMFLPITRKEVESFGFLPSVSDSAMAELDRSVNSGGENLFQLESYIDHVINPEIRVKLENEQRKGPGSSLFDDEIRILIDGGTYNSAVPEGLDDSHYAGNPFLSSAYNVPLEADTKFLFTRMDIAKTNKANHGRYPERLAFTSWEDISRGFETEEIEEGTEVEEITPGLGMLDEDVEGKVVVPHLRLKAGDSTHRLAYPDFESQEYAWKTVISELRSREPANDVEEAITYMSEENHDWCFETMYHLDRASAAAEIIKNAEAESELTLELYNLDVLDIIDSSSFKPGKRPSEQYQVVTEAYLDLDGEGTVEVPRGISRALITAVDSVKFRHNDEDVGERVKIPKISTEDTGQSGYEGNGMKDQMFQ